jgi:Sulfotransferase domain
VLPNLIVIGARKSGTSSLYHYLACHPEVTMSRRKELRFFGDRYSRWDRGVDWYEAQFDGADTPVRGEASPAYTSYPVRRQVPEQMCQVVPDARLIYLVRDPIERIVSEYVDSYSEWRALGAFAQAIRTKVGQQWLAVSSYHQQLERFLAHYPQEQILVIATEELRDHRRETLGAVFEFVGVDPTFDSARFDVLRNQSSELRRIEGPAWVTKRLRPKSTGRIPWDVRARVKRALYAPWLLPVQRPELEPSVRRELVERFAPEMERFHALTGKRFEQWSIWREVKP